MSKKQKKLEPIVLRDAPTDVARVMRKEAIKNTGKEPAFRIYRGWRLGLSYGPVPIPTREMWEQLRKLPGGIKALLAKFDDLKKLSGEVPDDFSYEQFREDLDKARGAAKVTTQKQWIFSASLHPRGRSSTEEDWRFFGEMAGALGASVGSLRTPLETTNPNDVHYHVWNESVDPSKAN